MSNPNKARGTRWESDLVNEFHASDLPDARRKVQTGAKDTGDISLGRWTIEAKAEKSIRLASYVDEANTEAWNARSPGDPSTPFGVAIVKRRGRNVRQAYVVMDLATFIRVEHLLRDLERRR